MNDSDRRALAAGEQAGARYALAAPRRAPLGAAGFHLSSRTGSSLEFKEHRDYQPGDDLRHIDWNAYARSDQLTVKRYHEEVNPHLDLVIDGSRSMALEASAKRSATLGLAALFAAAAANAGYMYRAWLADAECQPVVNGHLRPVLWEDIDFRSTGSPAAAFAHRPPAWRPHGIRVVLSDLLWVADPLHFLGVCAERAAAVVIVQILAAADADPPHGGNVRLCDAESEQVKDLFLDGTARRRYRDNLTRHEQNWHRAARQAGAVLATVIAEDVRRDWKLDELVAREVLEVM